MKTRSITPYAIGAPLCLILIATVVVSTQHKSTARSTVNVNSDDTAARSVESAIPETPSQNLQVTVDGQTIPVKKNGTTRTSTDNSSVTVTNNESQQPEATNSNSVNLNVSTDTTNSSTHTTTTIRHNATTSTRSNSSVHVNTSEDANINVSK